MSFIRCDRGRPRRPPLHRARAGPASRYVHRHTRCAISTRSLPAASTFGSKAIPVVGHRSSHPGQPIFDYWRDPEGFLVEHFADGDMFDNTLEPGWAPFTASGLAQWGPPVTKDFLGITPRALPHEARSSSTHCATTTNSTSAACAAF